MVKHYSYNAAVLKVRMMNFWENSSVTQVLVAYNRNDRSQYFYNLEAPESTGDWSLRGQLQFMFTR